MTITPDIAERLVALPKEARLARLCFLNNGEFGLYWGGCDAVLIGADEAELMCVARMVTWLLEDERVPILDRRKVQPPFIVAIMVNGITTFTATTLLEALLKACEAVRDAATPTPPAETTE